MPLVGFLRPVVVPASEGAAARSAAPADAVQPQQQAGRASYVRPTPAAPAPRMVLDDADGGLGIDWARRAAQAVVAHARFMDWVDRPKPAHTGESVGIDTASAVSAYGEFSNAADTSAADPKES